MKVKSFLLSLICAVWVWLGVGVPVASAQSLYAPRAFSATPRGSIPMVNVPTAKADGSMVNVPAIDTANLRLGNLPLVEITQDVINGLQMISPLMEPQKALSSLIGSSVPAEVILPLAAAFNAQNFSMANIAQLSGVALSSVALSDLGGLNKLPLKNLTEGIAGLNQMLVKDVFPVAALATQLMGNPGSLMGTLLTSDAASKIIPKDVLAAIPPQVQQLMPLLTSGTLSPTAIAALLPTDVISAIPPSVMQIIPGLASGNLSPQMVTSILSSDVAGKVLSPELANGLNAIMSGNLSPQAVMGLIPASTMSALPQEVQSLLPGLANGQVSPQALVSAALPKLLGDEIAQMLPANIQNMKIGDAMNLIPALADAKLEQLPTKVLSSLAVDAVPGLAQATLKDIPGAAQAAITSIPGLAKVPVEVFGFKLIPNPIPVRMDVFLGNKEKARNRAVSGTIPSADQKLVPLPCEKECIHVEIQDLSTEKKTPEAGKTPESYDGYSWMTEEQKGPDCVGPLGCIPNGGKGPVGTHSYGPTWRVILRKLSEKEGSVEAAAAVRACWVVPFMGLNCTPAGIPFTFPLTTLKEKQTFHISRPGDYVGQSEYGGASVQDGSGEMTDYSCVGGLTGEAADKIIAAAPAAARSCAKKSVPIVFQGIKECGITDPAQIAYIFSTVETETTMGCALFEGSTRSQSTSTQYYGRGFVQLTHRENYAKADQRYFGGKLNLLANPDKAAEPAIAAKILACGMRDGLFTGVGLKDFIGGGRANFVGARQIVNDHDKEVEMAGQAERYLQALKGADVGSLKSSDNTCGSGEMKSTNGYIDPTKGKHCVTSEQGPRNCPIHGPETHEAIDLAWDVGTLIVASKEGKVTFAGWNSCCGNMVKIQHPDGRVTKYCHMSALSARSGATVNQGQPIGRMGSTGSCTTGSHMHFAILENGSPVNPRKFANFNGRC